MHSHFSKIAVRKDLDLTKHLQKSVFCRITNSFAVYNAGIIGQYCIIKKITLCLVCKI